jgi:Cdc6-like AAA superfamily ATPase
MLDRNTCRKKFTASVPIKHEIRYNQDKKEGVSMLKKFEVRNFKQFSHISIDFSKTKDYQFSRQCLKEDMVKNALIYGANASGKSNFGLALFDIVQHLTDKNKNAHMYGYYVNADNPTEPVEFSYEFLFGENTIVYHYEKSDVRTLLKESLTINHTPVFSYDHTSGKKEISSLYGMDKLNWEFHGNNMSALRYIANNTVLPQESPLWELMNFVDHMLWFRRGDQQNEFIGLRTGNGSITDYLAENNLTERFEAFLHEYGISSNLKLAKGPDDRYRLYFDYKTLIDFNTTASSGTKALQLFFFWLTQTENISLLFIDEFDAFYHYALAEKILKYLIEKVNHQVILTTHNIKLLSNRLVRPDCCFIIDPGKIRSFSDSTERELREGNSIENLYMHGEFDE